MSDKPREWIEYACSELRIRDPDTGETYSGKKRLRLDRVPFVADTAARLFAAGRWNTWEECYDEAEDGWSDLCRRFPESEAEDGE